MFSRWFGGGHAGGGKQAEQDDVIIARVERLERENSRLETIAVEQSGRAERLQAELDAARKGAKQLRKAIVDMTAQHATTMQHQRHDYMLTIVEQNAKIQALTSAKDVATANFEWARLMFNKGEHERAILTSRILERQVQAFTLDREPSTPAPAPNTSAAATTDRPTQPTSDVMEQAIGGLANRFGVLFEDVGDDEARRMGLDHDPGDIAP